MLPVIGKPLLQHHIERVRKSEMVDQIVVATTTNDADEPIVELCNDMGVACTRGSEHDVLRRYYEASCQYSADIVVRVTSDCPLIDPAIIDLVVQTLVERIHNADYVSNWIIETFPLGLEVEALPIAVLAEANRNASRASDREHVTQFVWRQPQRYRLTNVSCQRRSKISPPGRSKTSPLDVMRYAVLGGVSR